MNQFPVRAGSMLFTLVDPHKGRESDYNRWYERDHFYAGCMVGPWLFAGKRWVATRAMKDLRFEDTSAVEGAPPTASPIDAGSYLAIYWIHEGHHKDHFDWAQDQVVALYENDRGFAERTHAHTAILDRPWAVYRDEDPVPIELALNHHYKGLGVVAVDPGEGVSSAALTAHLRDEALPELLRGSPIASQVAWHYVDPAGGDTDQAPMDLGTPPGPPERELQLFFLEDEPAKCWDRFHAYAERLKASGMGRVIFAAPFLATDVGTDRYADELW